MNGPTAALLAVATLVALGSLGGTQAATIAFDECPGGVCGKVPSVVLSGFDVQVPDVVTGFPSGIFGSGLGPDNAVVGLNTTGAFTTTAPDTVGTAAIEAVLADGGNQPLISDAVLIAFSVTGGVAEIGAAFQSGVAAFGIPAATEGIPFVTETGGLQDLSGDFYNIFGASDHVALPPELSIFVRSDLADVPEPGTLGVLGIGLGAIALGASRRRD